MRQNELKCIKCVRKHAVAHVRARSARVVVTSQWKFKRCAGGDRGGSPTGKRATSRYRWKRLRVVSTGADFPRLEMHVLQATDFFEHKLLTSEAPNAMAHLGESHDEADFFLGSRFR